MLIRRYNSKFHNRLLHLDIIILSHCKFASLSLIAKRITFKRKKWHSCKKLHYRSSLSALFAPPITTALLPISFYIFQRGFNAVLWLPFERARKRKKKSLCWRNYLDHDRTNWRHSVASHGWISFSKIIRKRLTLAARH